MAPITPLNPGLEKNDNTRLPWRTCFQISAVIASIFIKDYGYEIFKMYSGNRGQQILLIELSLSGPENTVTSIADFLAPRIL